MKDWFDWTKIKEINTPESSTWAPGEVVIVPNIPDFNFNIDPIVRGKLDIPLEFPKARIEPKQIYLVGSLRNPEVIILGKKLRDFGFRVFDDWYSAGHEADDKWKEYELHKGLTYKEALAGAAARNVFEFDRRNISASDIVILVTPAGKSGHLELGWAAGIGKHTIIHFAEENPDRWDVMYQFANYISMGMDDLLQHLEGQR